MYGENWIDFERFDCWNGGKACVRKVYIVLEGVDIFGVVSTSLMEIIKG